MAKTLTEAQVTTRNARSKLPAGLALQGILSGGAPGALARKDKRGGVWFVRWRNGRGYPRYPSVLRTMNCVKGRSITTLPFDGRERRLRMRAKRRERLADGRAPTVRAAVEAYVTEREKRPFGSDAGRLGRYVMGREKRGKRDAISASPLADKTLHTLTERDLLNWRNRLPDTLKATSKQRLWICTTSRRRLMPPMWKIGRELDPTLPAIIKHGLKGLNGHSKDTVPAARDNQILADAKVGKLISACFRKLIRSSDGRVTFTALSLC